MRRSLPAGGHRVTFLGVESVKEENCAEVFRVEKTPAYDGSGPRYAAADAGRAGPRFPNLHALFHQKAMHQEDLLLDAPLAAEKKVDVEEATPTATAATAERSIDAEAAEFIRRKHHYLEMQRLASVKAA